MFQRFYHVYKNHELDDLVNDVGGLVTCDSGYESGNYYVVVKKKEWFHFCCLCAHTVHEPVTMFVI